MLFAVIDIPAPQKQRELREQVSTSRRSRLHVDARSKAWRFTEACDYQMPGLSSGCALLYLGFGWVFIYTCSTVKLSAIAGAQSAVR